ncbi:NAD(P)H-dependent flavin oxidoreductase [Acaryochloris marina]|uniref:Oxidoreductase, 2-nitropropane dioxygenase family n=1 Tax=Acaryochloris marina (strain MBIC 11017) TaxID=329726 RepID=B0CB25_ACAM1|nr:nitronate monooxygenase family protein [Acaryochloris marina]ABW25515.1 oxidoreductase, 2-nitropropane dioxygenase family [Acaryochloris marina MBIC11017]
MNTLPPLRIGQHIARYPIIQGGMGIRISGAKLAAAVANAGGIGIISAVGLGLNSPYFDPSQKAGRQRREQFFTANRLALIDELNLARSLSPEGIIGINIMVAANDYETLVRTAVEHGVNLIIAGAGLPLGLPAYTQAHPEVALVPIVSTTRAAKLICQKWQRQHHRLPDAFIVENPQTAGGHLGAKLEDLNSPRLAAKQVIPELTNYLQSEISEEIPVIAAGGVWDRTDIDWMLALGASGVQMGTRFITTNECDADRRYKEFHLHAHPEDVVLVPSPVGMPGRALRNSFAERAIANSPDLEKRCLTSCLHVCRCRDTQETYCIVRALDRASQGDVENGLIFAGSNAGRAQQIIPVAELMQELTASL